jgi:hypothetical protein
MKFLIALFALVSLNAFSAEKVVLECITPGDALEAVQLIQKDGASIIRVEFLVDETEDGNVGHEDFTITASLKNILKGDADTLVGTSHNTEEFGGARTNAILIRVLPGQKSALLAKDGAVYTLSCHK